MRHMLRTDAFVLFAFVWSSMAFATCTVNGQVGYCVAPDDSHPWYCSGSTTDAFSNPECVQRSVPPTGGDCAEASQAASVLAAKEGPTCGGWHFSAPPADLYVLGIKSNESQSIICNNSNVGGNVGCNRLIQCPFGYVDLTDWTSGEERCFASAPPEDPDKNKGCCGNGGPSTGWPIFIGTGNKFLTETDIVATAGGLEFRRSWMAESRARLGPIHGAASAIVCQSARRSRGRDNSRRPFDSTSVIIAPFTRRHPSRCRPPSASFAISA